MVSEDRPSSEVRRDFISGSAEFRTYLDQHDDAVKWAQAGDLAARRIKDCLFDKGPNLLEAEEGEDTDTLMIVEVEISSRSAEVVPM